MSLHSGAHLGPYQVLAAVGAGGMGEVYRARDTKLNREVALKVLPDLVAGDPERLARFKREAQLLASLNHPNIAAIYGFEESGGVQALVLELVEGPTLADRIEQGPVPLDEAMPIARQMAEALEAAHEKGIIHRDLKPSNIKLRPDGAVKVLDFGVAKALEPEPEPGADTSAPPVITTAATGLGIVLGTVAYMAPEQAKGHRADRRSDIWAFGCVLYEMLTGRRAFEGEGASDTFAAVLRDEPDWSALPGGTPAAVRTLLARCLEKDRAHRLADISIACFIAREYASLATGPAGVRPPSPHAEPLWKRLAVFAAPALLAGAAIAGWAVWHGTRPAAPGVVRTTVTTPPSAMLAIDDTERDVAVTPDGQRVVYVGNNGTQLFVRALDALEPVAIASGLIRGPFVSPDGHWVGFVENATTLKKVAVTGGSVITVTTLDGVPRGATWLPDDTIVFATNNTTTGLQRVSSNGGKATVLTRPDRARGEADHLWPDVLPGGRAILFMIGATSGGLDAAQVAVLDLGTNTSTILVRGATAAHYVASGHLVYAAAGTLRAVLFDLSSLAVRGGAVPVVPRMVTTGAGAGDFGVAADGTLVYVEAPPGYAVSGRTLVWVDRAGKETPIPAEPRAYQYSSLSPDGTRLAISITDQEYDIWVWDLQGAALTRLTFDPGQDTFPMWTHDGRRIVFASQRDGGVYNLWWQASGGTGTAERLTTSPNPQLPTGVSPDGTQVVLYETTPDTGRDILSLTLDKTLRVAPLLQTPFEERNAAVSPDGRWLAYESNSSGRFEVYARPFPNTASGQWQVSTAGGTRPVWAHSGNEMFFLGADGALMRVPIEATAAAWKTGVPTKLLEPRYYTGGGGNPGRTYDVAPDGQRFLMIKTPGAEAASAAPQIVVVQHFDEELKRLVPAP